MRTHLKAPSSTAVVVALLAAACTAPTQSSWAVRFADPWTGPTPRSATLEIRRGGCDGPPVFSATVRPEDMGERAMPDDLEDGIYGFAASARDGDCRAIGASCVDVRLPIDAGKIVTTIVPSTPVASCAPEVCDDGRCPECESGRADCNGEFEDGCEVDVEGDVAHCGGCGVVCGAPNRSSACVAGECELGDCRRGFADCDTEAANGCEISTDDDRANCGACDERCAPSELCEGGVCAELVCEPGVDASCDGDATTGCETPLGTATDCGGCGQGCGLGGTCIGGVCDDVITHMAAQHRSVLHAVLPDRRYVRLGYQRFTVPDGEATSMQNTLGLVGAAFRTCAFNEEEVRCYTDRHPFESTLLDSAGLVSASPDPRSFMNDARVCGLDAAGALTCWESNLSAPDRSGLGLPLAVESFGAASRGASPITCVRTAAGEIHCVGPDWAESWACQASTPAGPARLEAAERFETLRFSSDTFCGVEAGRVFCGGLHEDGALGVGPPPQGGPCLAPGRVRDIEDARALVVDRGTACAIDGVGRLYCWGSGGPFLSTDTVEEYPVLQEDVPPSRDLVSYLSCAHVLGEDDVVRRYGSCAGPGISARGAVDFGLGQAHACARRINGRVACWGLNVEGQLGDGTTESRARPQLIEGIPPASDLAVGFRHTCIVGREDRRVYCWGSNRRGELGDGVGDETPHPDPQVVPGVEGAVQVVALRQHTCARLEDGSIRCWGGGSNLISADDVSGPTQLLTTDEAVDVAVTQSAVCVRTTDDDIVCQGGAERDELGTGGRGLFAGVYALCWLDRDDNALCMGFGRDADGAGFNAMVTPHDMNIADVHDLALAPGHGDPVAERHICVVLRDGGVGCWGDNHAGQLGRETGDGAQPFGRVPSITNAVRVEVGDATSCARLETGALVCWGAGRAGELGNGSNESSTTPVPVHGF